MATETLRENKTLKERTDDFLFKWHKFPIDYWWRKKYKVAFGSAQHREMSLIDMFIEYKEEVNMLKLKKQLEKEEEQNPNAVPISQEEIDDDYENLDLDSFDNK
jgi:hypothetical protein